MLLNTLGTLLDWSQTIKHVFNKSQKLPIGMPRRTKNYVGKDVPRCTKKHKGKDVPRRAKNKLEKTYQDAPIIKQTLLLAL